MKMSGVNITKDQTQGAKINWGKIAGKATNGAKTLFEPIMPATINTVSSASSLIRDARNATRANRSLSRRNTANMKNSTENKRALSLFKSAFDDIESGSFSMNKINDSMFDDYESTTSDAFKMPTGDDAVEMSSEEILLLGNKGVAQSIIQSSSAQLKGIEASSKALINANIKSTQALGMSINNTLIHGFNSINTTLLIQNQKLDALNRNMEGLLQFNNTNALEYYTKSIDMLSGVGKMMENFQKSMMPDSRKKGRSFDTTYGFDIREYGNYIKEGIKESLFGSSVQMAGSAVKQKDFGLVGMLMETIIPKAIKEPMQKFDKTMSQFMNEGLKRIGEYLNNGVGAFLGLGDIFGNKRETLKNINLGAYMKDATPWNGIAQKALVEVIPELLTSIDSKLDHSEKRYYDYDKGQFRNKRDIEKEFENEYFDTFAIMLRDSMDTLKKSSAKTGKSENDQESLLRSIQALIDDQISGKKSTMSTRTDMVSAMKEFGIDKTGITDFITEFQDGLENAISRINDLYHEIGSTQSIYRNINNTYGKEYTSRIKNMHSSHKRSFNKSIRYDEYSFGIIDSAYINNIRKNIGLPTRNDDTQEFINRVSLMKQSKASDEEIQNFIREHDLSDAVGNRIKKNSSNLGFAGRVKTRINKAGSTLNKAVDTARNKGFDYVFMGHKKNGNIDEVPTGVKNAVATINDLNSEDYDTSMKRGQDELERDQKKIDKNLQTIINDKSQPETVEGSIIKSNNMLQSALGAIISSFKGFTSRLFGKEGIIRRLWDTDIRKKTTDKLKTKLFTGEDAIFKNQYDAVRSGWKTLKTKTKEQLGRGYDFLYDNTMKYMYGYDEDGNEVDYTTSERYKNNKFVSETLNRKWRAEQKKKKAEEAAKANSIPVQGDTKKEIVISEEQVAATASASEDVTNAVANTASSVQESAKNLEESMNAFTEATVGDPNKNPSQKKKAFQGDFLSKLKKTMPKALAGSIAGAGVGLLNNQFSLLGSMFLPGGPIAGAIVGGGLSILSQTEAFKAFMFGKQDPETQKREGGLITQKMQDKFKKMMPFAVGGAVLGGLKGLMKGALGFNSGLGVLGMQILPGGILGGALMGAGLGILKNSDSFKDMLFGKKDENGKRSGKMMSNSFNKMKSGFSKLLPGFKKAAAGLGIGALSGAVLSNAGYLPAMLSLGGPVGMGIAGLGIGIASSTEKFNEWMFGTKDPETGERRKDGLLTRATNMLRLNVIEPIGDAFKTKMLDLVDWTKDKITYPFRMAIGPIVDSLSGIKDNVVEFVKDKFDAIGTGISNMISKTLKTLFSPITKLVGFVGKSIAGIASTGAKLALSPISGGLQLMQFLTMGKRRKEYMSYAKDYYGNGGMTGALNEKWAQDREDGNERNFFGKISDTVGAFLGQGEAASIAKNKWADKRTAEGANTADWMRISMIGDEKRQHRQAVKQRHQEESRWRKIDKERVKLADELGNRELTLSDSKLKYYQKKFGSLGISGEHLQSSDDIMDLLYRRDEFKQKLAGNPIDAKSDGIPIQETPEQKAARENTEKFQNEIKESFKKLITHLGADKPSSENLTEIAQDIKESSKDSADANIVQAEFDTNGEFKDGVKPDRRKNLKSSIVKKFSALTAFLGFKKKEEAEDAENSESIEAREGNDQIDSRTSIKKKDGTEEKAEKKSFIGKLWDKIKSVGSLISGSKVGSFIIKGVKFAGAVGLLGSIGLTVAELIKPGTSAKIGAKIDAFNDYVNSDDFGIKKVFNDFSNWFNETFIGKWWNNKVTPWWDETVVPWWKEKALPTLQDIPGTILEKLPGLIEKTGDFVSEHADELVSAFTTAITDIGVPLATAIAKSAPEILSAVLDGSWQVLKALGSSIIDMIKGKDAKEDISDDKKKDLEQNGTQVATEEVGTVIAKDIEEAKRIAKDTYGLDNPVIDVDVKASRAPNALGMQKYIISQNVSTGRSVARDEDTGERVTVTDSNMLRAASNLGTKVLGDYAFNAFGGRGKLAGKIAGKGLSLGATVGGKIMQGVGKLGSNTLGNIPVLGVPFKAAGKAIEGTGKLLEGVSHPINSIKSAYGGIKKFLLGTNAVEEAAEAVADNGTRYAKNAAGKWYDVTTGKFVKKEVAEAGIRKVSENGLINNILHPIQAIKQGGQNIVLSAKDKLNKVLHPIDTIKNGATAKIDSIKDFASSTKNKIDDIAGKIGGFFKKKATTEIAEESSEKIIKETVESSTEKVAKEAFESTQQSTLETLLKKLSKWLDDIITNKTMIAAAEKAAKQIGQNSGDNILKKLAKFLSGTIDNILLGASKCTKKLIDLATAAVSKISAKLGIAAGTLGIGEIVSIGTGAVFGAFDAANLFQTKEPDWIMRIVSSLIEALLASSIGSAIDFLFEATRLVGDVLGKDWNFKKDIAEFLYKLLSGFSQEAINKLEVGQSALQAEKDVYNALNNTNLSLSAYNDEANKTVFSKGLDLGKKGLRGIGKIFGQDWFSDSVDTKTADEARKKLNARGITDAQIADWAQNDTTKLNEALKSVGYGSGSKSPRLNSLYAQGNPKWANLPIGRLPDGSIATMAKAGCGPTAMAAVANTVAQRSLGYGPITPADMAAYAASNGYISQGGANAGLFTEGAKKLGLNSATIKNSSDLMSSLRAGRPAVLSGKSSSSNDPYTKAGHIVVADGIVGNKMSVMDPITGKHKLYDAKNVSKKTKHAWSYSAGYGPVGIMDGDTRNEMMPMYHLDTKSSIKNAASNSILSNNEPVGEVDFGTESTDIDNTSTSVMDAEQLKEYASNQNFLGKLKLVGNVFAARVQSMTNNTPFWEEFNKLTTGQSSENNSLANATISGTSRTLAKILSSPANIQEELLGKTIERAYIAESGGNYSTVITDTNGKVSVGPFQANGGNAVTLLNDIASATGLPFDLKSKFKSYASIITNTRGKLTDSQRKELSSLIDNDEYRDIITAAIDRNAMKWYHNTFYKGSFSNYYDTGIIKDLRTFPMLADIGTTGPGFITNSGWKSSFISNWTPTSKATELDSAHNVLISPNVYYRGSKYSSGYLRRINDTYEAMKNYKIKNPISQGKMKEKFGSGTNPLGFGPDDNDDTITISAVDQFTSGISSIGKEMINHFGRMTGFDPSEFGLTDASSSTDSTNFEATDDDYEYHGVYRRSGPVIEAVTGNDRDRFLALAKTQIGYIEKANGKDLKSFSNEYNNTDINNNYGYTKYAKEMGSNPNPWCAYFTSWAAKGADVPASIVPRNGGCLSIMNAAKAAGTMKYRGEYNPSPGDLILYNWNGVNKPRQATSLSHIGIVASRNGNTIKTIEGNVSIPGTPYHGVAEKEKDATQKSIVGYVKPEWRNERKTVYPPQLLSLGYGDPTLKNIDSIASQEQFREKLNDTGDFKVSPKDFEAIGFGPGMTVDAGFDMSNTDSKLEKIFGLMAEWYAESKNSKPSSATNNINVVKADTTNVATTTARGNIPAKSVQRYKESMVNNHSILSTKAIIRKNM